MASRQFGESSEDAQQPTVQPEQLPEKIIDIMTYLNMFPKLRPAPVLRGGEQLARYTDDATPKNHAILMATRGRIAKPECKKCANGMGPFANCIVMDGDDGVFGGACANCKYLIDYTGCLHYNKELVEPQAKHRGHSRVYQVSGPMNKHAIDEENPPLAVTRSRRDLKRKAEVETKVETKVETTEVAATAKPKPKKPKQKLKYEELLAEETDNDVKAVFKIILDDIVNDSHKSTRINKAIELWELIK